MSDANKERRAWDKAAVIIQAIASLAILVSIAGLWVGAKQFSEQQKATAAQTLDQERQATLSGYLDQMSTLVLQDNLRKSKFGAPVRAIADALTDSASRSLDGTRRGTLIRYLWQTGLIFRPDSVIFVPRMDLDRAKLRGALLLQADLSFMRLSGADFTGAMLNGATFLDSYMRASNLTSAHLGCDYGLAGDSPVCSDLDSADLSHAILVRAKLIDARLTSTVLTKAKLRGADLRGSYMGWSNLTSADLGCFYRAGGKRPTCANLAGADLSHAQLRNTILVGANLGCYIARIDEKRPTCANLTGADLSGAHLRNTILLGANLTAEHLARADLTKARYNSKPIHTYTFTIEPTKWPRGFDVSTTGAVCVDC
jgi:uncharacterized protein YjbI with pentapeptide repeats